ncbi:MAG: HAD-IA family hydrolase [Bacteroidetes bacterium]|jgi:phosphoglycolate phosphatase|nr:HAD-IA family hydrolase [Bacteroidota bacterium]
MPALDEFDLLVFDLDGTLVDSRYDLADAVNFAMEKMGRPQLAYDDLPPLLGSGLRYLLEKAAGTADRQQVERAKQHFDDYYEQHFTDKTRLYPGVMSTLQALDAKTKAIYSNKMQYFTGRIADALGLREHMAMVQGAQPESFALKPDPEGLYRILRKLDTPANKALMIGDSTHDLEAGRAAGMKTCAVTYGYRPAAVLKKQSPDYIVDRFPDLLSIG